MSGVLVTQIWLLSPGRADRFTGWRSGGSVKLKHGKCRRSFDGPMRSMPIYLLVGSKLRSPVTWIVVSGSVVGSIVLMRRLRSESAGSCPKSCASPSSKSMSLNVGCVVWSHAVWKSRPSSRSGTTSPFLHVRSVRPETVDPSIRPEASSVHHVEIPSMKKPWTNGAHVRR